MTAPNRPPVAAGSQARTRQVDETADVDLSPFFSDPDGDALVFTATVSDAAVVGASEDGGVLTVGSVAKGEATCHAESSDVEVLTATASGSVISVAGAGSHVSGWTGRQ